MFKQHVRKLLRAWNRPRILIGGEQELSTRAQIFHAGENQAVLRKHTKTGPAGL